MFADSLYYGKSQGGDVSIPWYMSSKGYGFVWNLPSLGEVSLSGRDKHQGIRWQSNATTGVDFYVTTTYGHGFHFIFETRGGRTADAAVLCGAVRCGAVLIRSSCLMLLTCAIITTRILH